jgi:hypothetical protein
MAFTALDVRHKLTAVVDPDQQCETATGYIVDLVQPLDHVHLPQGAGEVQESGIDPGQQDAQLTPVTRLRQGNMPDVVLEVEIRVPGRNAVALRDSCGSPGRRW